MSTRTRVILIGVATLAVLAGLFLLIAPGPAAGVGIVLAGTVAYALVGCATRPLPRRFSRSTDRR
jgi:hypothetical protein